MERSFRYAIVRVPCPEMVNGITSSNLGIPDYSSALIQHSSYVRTLEDCGLSVKVLDAESNFPDSTFIEDVALCTSKCAIITKPRAPTRSGEIAGMRQILSEFFSEMDEIKSPGTLEAGDVLMAEDHFFIGISGRTNNHGADQLIHILQNYGFTCSKITLSDMLHLKSGASYLGNGYILLTGELAGRKEFSEYNRIFVSDDESYAANSLWINGTVLVPDGFPRTRHHIERAGIKTISLNVSEFRKLDGGLSCLSLRF